MFQKYFSVRFVLHVASTLIVAAFLVLGAVSLVNLKRIDAKLGATAAASQVLDQVNEVENVVRRFINGGDARPSFAEVRSAIELKRSALARLGDATLDGERSAALQSAKARLGVIMSRARSVEAARPILEASRDRINAMINITLAAMADANKAVAEVATDQQADRAVHEGPFLKLVRLQRLLTDAERGLQSLAAKSSDAPSEAALRQSAGRLRFLAPRDTPSLADAWSAAFAQVLQAMDQSRSANDVTRLAAFQKLQSARDALISNAAARLEPSAAGLATASEVDRMTDWAKVELGRAVVNSAGLRVETRAFLENPTTEGASQLRSAVAKIFVRLEAALASDAVVAPFVDRAKLSLRDLDATTETIIRVWSEAQGLERDVIAETSAVAKVAVETVAQVGVHAEEVQVRADIAIIAAVGVGLLTSISALLLVHRRLLRPFRDMTGAMKRISGGDLDTAIAHTKRCDEVGDMAQALGVFRENAVSLRSLSEEKAAQAETVRKQIEALLLGIRVLNDAEDIAVMFEGVLGTLARLVEFEQAVILVEDRGRFVTVASSAPTFSLEIGPFEGEGAETTAEFQLSLLEDGDYRITSPIKAQGYRSALIAPLATRNRRAMIICASKARDAFNASDLSAVRAFTPLAEQAVRKSEQVDELEGAVRNLDAMAHHDTLTGLKNRTSFINEIDNRREAAEAGDDPAFALFHIDLDHFKAINDSLGHAAGDYALTWASHQIQSCLRRTDLVARLGGDEFAVILSEDEEPTALIAIAQKLVERLSSPFDYDGKTLQMGASIGIGRYPADSDDPSQILHIADMALLEAKSSGRGRFAFFNGPLRRELERRQTLELKLRDAFAANEFELWYQPIFSLKTRKVMSFEGLIRWRSKSFGLVSPGDFLPVAEQAGLMGKIGEWVMGTACEDLSGWLNAVPGRRVAVNVSAVQLSTPDFVSQADDVAQRWGVDPSMLELELSEEIAVRRSAEVALDNLTALSERGFQIAFDDFGTGYSSLEHLRRFPGQRMKIDRSFINIRDRSDDEEALARGLFYLAKSLGMEVVAEGVETQAQLEFCQEVGCDEVQGFLLAKPAPLEEALARAERIEREFEGGAPITTVAVG